MTEETYIILIRPISSSWHGPSAYKLNKDGGLVETTTFVLEDSETGEYLIAPVPDWSDGTVVNFARVLIPMYSYIRGALSAASQ